MMELIVAWVFAVFVGGGIIFIIFAPHFPWLKHRSASYRVVHYEVWEDIRGRAHRTSGPAIIDALGIIPPQWFWHGEDLLFDDWCKIVGVSKKKKALLLLKYKV